MISNVKKIIEKDLILAEKWWFYVLAASKNLFTCPQILTVTSLTCKQQKRVCEFFILKYVFSESDFCTITSHFFNTIISKMF